jgi:branched-chain amino acid transport system substrate-binding protein
MFKSKAVTKIQTITLIAITLIALASAAVVYYSTNINSPINPIPTPTPSSPTPEPSIVTPTSSTTPASTKTPATTTLTKTPTPQPKEPIIIGVCADLDQPSGTRIFQGAILAVEQINAAGGLLGCTLTVVAEDDDSATPPYDNAVAVNALNRLISVDKADYIMSIGTYDLAYQDICSEQKKIHFSLYDPSDNLTQRISDNYDKYKYSFRGEYLANGTTMNIAHVQSLAMLKNITGFTKVGYLMYDSATVRGQTVSYFENELPKLGFQITYRALFSPTTMDFSSYFAQAEAAKTEMLFVIQTTVAKSAAVVNEWCNRQSPMLLCGDIGGAVDWDFWNLTSGNTEYVLTKNTGLTMNYPVTSKTAAVKDAYLARYGVPMLNMAAAGYDVVKFFLADAITRAGTTDTDAVIKALETINIDTVLTNDFKFTSNHDIYVDVAGMINLAKTTMLYIVIQWQNGVQVPILPDSLRAAAGATIKYPPWKGPWSP